MPTIAIVEETGSTNADLVQRLASGECISEGHWLCALSQSGGKGRSGRRWISPPGNLYTSTVVNLREGDPAAHTLSLAIGLGVHRFVRDALSPAHRDHVKLKWPNDVLVRGAKVAGILLERVRNTVVVGVGVNIEFAPHLEGRQTTCIRDLSPHYEADIHDALSRELAPRVAEQLRDWRNDTLVRLIERWTAAAHPVGSCISVNTGGGQMLVGAFAGLDESGSLKLRLADNSIRTIHAGDVSLVAEGKS